MTVEVFKTNVMDEDRANKILDELHRCFDHYMANFDLDDCDRILRVKSAHGSVHPLLIINLLKRFGYDAEVLPDEILPAIKRIPVDSALYF